MIQEFYKAVRPSTATVILQSEGLSNYVELIAASVAKRCDPACKAVYNKKRAEGKRYTEANIIVARKLVRVIYAVWTKGKPYKAKVA